jgi:hypothetical protein
MKISVTQEHINKVSRARWCEFGNCPVAIAIKEALGGKYPFLHVCLFELHLDRYSDAPGIPLPAEATCWIKRFDGMAVVEPFEFEFPGLGGVS